MSQQKRNRNYTFEDFSNLFVTKVGSIANALNFRDVKKYKKEEPITVEGEKVEKEKESKSKSTAESTTDTHLPSLSLSNKHEIENLTEYPALSVIHNAIYILECIDKHQCLYNKFGKTDFLIDRLQQHYKRHGTFKVKAVYPCRNPSVIESKLKSELNLKRIAVEATGKNGEKITELFLPEHFDTIDKIIRHIIQMDSIENDTNLALERERTKQKEIDERIEIQHTEQLRITQHTEQLRLQLELAKLNGVQCGKKNQDTQQTMDSYFSKSKKGMQN